MRRPLALAGLLVAVLAGPAAADGKHVPDEPYVWGSGTAELVSPVYRDGSSPPMNASTPETGPQASVAVPQGALAVVEGASWVGVSLTVAEATTRSGPALSNAYALDLRDDRGRELTSLPEKRAVTVLLRAATVPTASVVAQLRTDDGTRELETRLVHETLYAVDVREGGVLVLVDRTARLDEGAELPVGPVGALSAGALVLVGSAAAVRRRNRQTGTAKTTTLSS